jgi:hypothetical protein
MSRFFYIDANRAASSVFILFDLTSAAKILTLTITPTAAEHVKKAATNQRLF